MTQSDGGKNDLAGIAVCLLTFFALLMVMRVPSVFLL